MQAALALLAVVSTASAHATWQEFWVGSEDQAGSCVRTVQDNSPIVSVTDATMACGRGPKATTGICTAAGMSPILSVLSPEKPLWTPWLTSDTAGSPVSVEMHQQPGQRDCGTEALGGNHYGPVYVYMAKVDDATTADGASASFFKVAEDTYNGTDASWGTEILNANCGKKTFTSKMFRSLSAVRHAQFLCLDADSTDV